MTRLFTYNKKERLKSRKQIEQLFTQGKSVNNYPVKLFYFFNSEDVLPNVKAGVGVSKKYFKSAVKRNRIKRLLREAYRLNKHIITDNANNKNRTAHIFFLYTSAEILSYSEIEKKVVALMTIMINK